jgi:hypothetical protein
MVSRVFHEKPAAIFSGGGKNLPCPDRSGLYAEQTQ